MIVSNFKGQYKLVSHLLTIFLGVFVIAGAFSLSGFLGMNDKIDGLVVEVDYFDHWNVTIVEDGSTWTWSGFGKMEKNMMRLSTDEWVIRVRVQKMDDSLGFLTVRVKLKDGTILKEAYTSEPYGEAFISLEIQ